MMIPPESGREEAIRVEREAVEIVQRIPVAECERTRAAAAESGLILAIIGVCIAAGLFFLGEEISSAFSSAGALITGYAH